MKSIKDLLKEFEQECALTHPECALRRDDLLMHGFAQGASRMREEFLRWRATSDSSDSTLWDKPCLLRFKFCGDASSDYFYAIGCSGPDDSWYVCADTISGEFIPLIDYLDALNEMFEGADAAFVDWRPIL